MRKKGVCCFRFSFFFVFILLASSFVMAADVAYLYKGSRAVDENIVDVFEDMGLTVENIQDADIPSTDFSNYRIIFVGDERFRMTEFIPIDEKPTVIANYYSGEVFGLTDRDGISKLASTKPLSVRKGSDVIQVYTQAEYSFGGISIPYYYLDDENTVPGFDPVARTYIGGADGDGFGDVISYASAGTKLANGMTTQAKVCFFGIIESDFWTPEARDLFEDCVGYVGMTCSVNSECGDDKVGENYCVGDDVYHDVREFDCENPGTVYSECLESNDVELVEECADSCVDGECVEIICSVNSECGTDGYVGGDSCVDDDVYRDYETFECELPGTPESSCSSSVGPILQEECVDICVDGACEERECTEDIQCGSDFTNSSYCFNNDVYADFIDNSCSDFECVFDVTPEMVADCGEDSCDGYVADYCKGGDVYRNRTCYDAGCFLDDCFNNDFVDEELVEECSDGCVNGECIVPYVECSNNSDCDDSSIYTLDECNNPGTTESYCSNTPINCINDNDCGLTGYYDDEFCFQQDIFKNYKNSTCVNDGTPESYCIATAEQLFLLDCGVDSCGDWQDDYCFGDDVYHDQVCYNRGCALGGCFSNISLNSGLVEECEFACAGGVCVNECVDDNECADDYAVNYCVGDDVWQEAHDFGCSVGSCSENVSDVFVESCAGVCVDGSCEGELVHDVGLIDFTDSVNGIKILNMSGDVVDSVMCGEDYKVYIKVENQGNYTENVTFSGEVGGVLFNHVSTKNLLPGESSDPKLKTVNFSLGSGLYNLSVEAIVPVDDDVSDNFAVREIEVVCGEPVACYQNTDCGIDWLLGVPYCSNDDLFVDSVYYVCENPGEVDSYCRDYNSSDSTDCGEDEESAWMNYCVGEDVYKNRTVEDRGCFLGSCFDNSNIENEFVMNCSYGCSNGACNNECSEDNECGDDYSVNYCVGKDVFKEVHDFGCEDASCEENVSNVFVESCVGLCVDGSCADPVCGNNILEAGEQCDDGNLINNDGCSAGCLTETIVCSQNSVCGADGFIGNSYCSSDNAYRNYQSFFCQNAGSVFSACTSSVSSNLIQNCGSDSCSDWGSNVCVGDNVYQKRTCYDRGCSAGDCFSNFNQEQQLVEYCADGCENGKCVVPYVECYDNSGCGVDVWSGNNFCSLDDLFGNFQTFTCVNPGTTASNCETSVSPNLVEDCGENYCDKYGENYCVGTGLYHSRICYNQGCSDAGCFSNNYNKEELVEKCGDACVDGKCEEIECYIDIQCDDDDEFTIDRCINKWTVESYCENTPAICEEKALDWFHTRYFSSKVQKNDGDSWEYDSDFINLDPKVSYIEPFTANIKNMQTAIEVEKDGYLIFKNKMRDGGRAMIKKVEGGTQLIQAIDGPALCPGGDNSACIYSRDGKLLYSHIIASHASTWYYKVIENSKYFGECPDVSMGIAKDESNYHCGLAETRVEVKAGDVVYFRGEDSNEPSGSGLELWEYVGCD